MITRRSPTPSRRAQKSDRPNLIACRTTIAFGAPTKAGTAAAHGAPLGAAEIAGARERLGWHYPPFVIPEDVRAEWRAAGARGAAVRRAWEAAACVAPAGRGEPNSCGGSAASCRQVSTLPIAKLCDDFRQANAKIATRQAVGHGARHPDTGGARAGRRLGRSDAVEQHQGQGPEGRPPRRFLRPLHPLRGARARHGGGDERHRRRMAG